MRSYRPKLWQKKLIKASDHDPKDFLFVGKTANNLKFVQKSTGKILDLKI